MDDEHDDPPHRTAIDDLATLRIFVAVVEAGSFTKAGRRLRIVPSTVSKHISALEAKLQSQFIIRSTQGLSVTELGMSFYERCREILQAVEHAENEVGEYQAEARGSLRLSCAPVLVGSQLIPILKRYLNNNPKVKLELDVTTVTQDLIANNLDAAIRISNNLDPDLIAVKLADNDRVYCATPAYLAANGTPETLADLTRHNCLIINNAANSADWPIQNPGGAADSIHVTGNLVTNSAGTVMYALLDNMRSGHIARFLVHEHLKSGELVELFPDHRVVVSSIYVVFPKRRDLPLKTRALIDHLRVEFSKPPWVDA